jgi:hypothetical protein
VEDLYRETLWSYNGIDIILQGPAFLLVVPAMRGLLTRPSGIDVQIKHVTVKPSNGEYYSTGFDAKCFGCFQSHF